MAYRLESHKRNERERRRIVSIAMPLAGSDAATRFTLSVGLVGILKKR